MFYHYEMTDKYGNTHRSQGHYTFSECSEIIRNLLPKNVVQFGFGFWTRNGVYVGRIIPVVASKAK